MEKGLDTLLWDGQSDAGTELGRRERNQWADDLTNQKFDHSTPERRLGPRSIGSFWVIFWALLLHFMPI